ncbi:DNA polymerase lambda [Sesamum angolense]|uniref:DNA polymerase n=1 Tax=Sesamum angolense TaxID=2727404 RepID=A0AAE1X0R8_9LAMI|nr:DNA polymerase lambda [Sesamum angolense]
MAPMAKNKSPASDPNGMFSGMAVFLVGKGVQARRLQIWKQKLVQMGAKVEDRFSRRVTHIFAVDLNTLIQEINRESLKRFEGKVLNYQWLEDSLRAGEKVPEASYILSVDSEQDYRRKVTQGNHLKRTNGNHLSIEDPSPPKKIKTCSEEYKGVGSKDKDQVSIDASDYSSKSDSANSSAHSLSPEVTSLSLDGQNGVVSSSDTSLLYSPPDLNRNITEIFGKLIDIYRALGDDRRSFSYYKAIPVIEKLPFKIESADQVKHLPGIGKSLQDHIQEIVNTGKLSKLEHFEKDEKVRTISLFGEVWGIGPATASKLYDKGHRTLDDLKNEESLTNSQRLGLKYFDDIKTRIPRHEVQEMESLLQKVGEEILPGVVIICGGSYRRGKSSCGDMDIVITHPDGKSHTGFLPKFVKRLKDMNFLREDLVYSIHSEEGTDSGVDTYFGLCTYPGRELRHRIDFKFMDLRTWLHLKFNIYHTCINAFLKNTCSLEVWPTNLCLFFPVGLSKDIYAFGLIAWTGNDVLNRRLRLLAESKGFRLDDTGLFPATHGSGGKRETEKFKTHLFKKLSKKDMFGDSIDEVVGICTQIFNEFLHAEYGGPGTLLVIPFIDMADTINERGLPGGPQAARAAVKWAQTHVDKDWKEWTST